jgi:hypothetical protein
VQVRVPSVWPLLDGDHTQFCYSPFPSTPTAFVGSQRNGAPSCPGVLPSRLPPGTDGVWLQSGQPPADPRNRTLPGGQQVLVDGATYASAPRLVDVFWYHGVQVTIGESPEPEVADQIRASLAYHPGAADTPVAQACGTSTSTAMPIPERLTQPLVLHRGGVVLEPPLPSDRAGANPASIWAASSSTSALETYRLILARFGSTFPEQATHTGPPTPILHNRLAWVVYSSPVSPTVSGCGGWGVSVFDAQTGTGITSEGWSPGP